MQHLNVEVDKDFLLFHKNFLDSLKQQLHERGPTVSSCNNINLKALLS